MSCIVLDIELADKNVFKELGVFIDSKVQGYSFRPPKKYKPKKQAFLCTRILHRIVLKSGRVGYSKLSNLLPRAVKGKYFAKETEKCKILGNLLDKEVESLKVTAVQTFKISWMKKFRFARVTRSDTRPLFTVQNV